MAKKRYIIVPDALTLTEPTGEPMKDSEEISFKDFVLKQMNNPIWMESYTKVLAGDALMEQIKAGKSVIVLDDDEWNVLKSAVENPKQVLNGPFGASTQSGYGWIPSVTPQLLPFIKAIMNASDKAPEAEEKKDN